MIAETTPQELNGTAFGLFNFIWSVLMVIVSWLRDIYSAEFTIY